MKTKFSSLLLRYRRGRERGNARWATKDEMVTWILASLGFD